MTDNSASLAFFSQISRCGKVILEVEEKALDSSLRSLFNKRNHAEFVAILSQKIQDLDAIATDMRRRGTTVGHAEGLHQLIHQLIGFATALRNVCTGLNERILRRPYSMDTFNADMNMVQIKRAACEQAQRRAFD